MAEEENEEASASTSSSNQEEAAIAPVSDTQIRSMIYTVRGEQVMLDSDLAVLYGVETRTLNQAVTRNPDRFPERFCFRLTKKESENLKSQFVISSSGGWGGRRTPPRAFTEGVLRGPGVRRVRAAGLPRAEGREGDCAGGRLRGLLQLRQSSSKSGKVSLKLAKNFS